MRQQLKCCVVTLASLIPRRRRRKKEISHFKIGQLGSGERRPGRPAGQVVGSKEVKQKVAMVTSGIAQKARRAPASARSGKKAEAVQFRVNIPAKPYPVTTASNAATALAGHKYRRAAFFGSNFSRTWYFSSVTEL